MDNKGLYETDFYSWVLLQTRLLKSGDIDRIDMENLIEEVEDMGKSIKRAIESYFVVLLTHLLKCEYQKENISGSWRGSIANSRNKLLNLIAENPGTKPTLGTLYIKAYGDAMEVAAAETGLPSSTFPDTPPWTLEESLVKGYIPNQGKP